MERNELRHYGVLGMRWGVRRYQNKDGTLTKAGKRRYDKEMEKLKEEERVLKNKKRTQAKIDKLEAKRKAIEDEKNEVDNKKSATSNKSESHTSKKSVRDMSDDELRAHISRMELEKNYNRLMSETGRQKTSNGKKFVSDIIERSGNNILTQLTTYGMGKLVNKMFESAAGEDVVNPKKGQKDK